jgi:hypothetical protein
VERGQVSFESILLWAGFLAVLGLFIPAFANALEAQKLQLEKERFLSFANTLEDGLLRVSHYAEGSTLTIPSPSFADLSILMEGDLILLEWSPPALSSSLSREIVSPLPLEGSWSPEGGDIILIRESDFILIESE